MLCILYLYSLHSHFYLKALPAPRRCCPTSRTLRSPTHKLPLFRRSPCRLSRRRNRKATTFDCPTDSKQTLVLARLSKQPDARKETGSYKSCYFGSNVETRLRNDSKRHCRKSIPGRIGSEAMFTNQLLVANSS